jgi:hypothetical protein
VLSNHRYKFMCVACVLAAVALLAVVSPVGADSMRCGKWVVSESVTVAELVSKCGEPRSKDVTKEDVYITSPTGARIKTDRVTVTERWVYQSSARALPMLVTIVDGKIVSLKRAD